MYIELQKPIQICYMAALRKEIKDMTNKAISELQESINDKKNGFTTITTEGLKKHKIVCTRANFLINIAHKVDMNPDWNIFKIGLMNVAEDLSANEPKSYVLKDTISFISFMEAAENIDR